MSTPGKPKDSTDLSNIFSIDLETGVEMPEMPSITKLTEMVKEKKAQPTSLAKSSHSNVPRLTPSPAPGPAPGLTPRPSRAPVSSAAPTSARPQASAPAKPAKPTRLPSISSIAVRSEESRMIEMAHKPKTLTELGVQVELLFEPERGSYRYVKMKPHARDSLALWQQKFYFQMKLDLKTLEVFGTFQEFNKDKHSFQAEAFALTDCDYVQIVRLESVPQKIFVLLSKDSLVDQEAVVKKLLEEAANPPIDDDFKIEMAS